MPARLATALWIGLCTAMSALTLTACGHSETLPLKPPPPNLAEPCPPLGEVRDGQAGTVLTVENESRVLGGNGGAGGVGDTSASSGAGGAGNWTATFTIGR